MAKKLTTVTKNAHGWETMKVSNKTDHKGHKMAVVTESDRGHHKMTAVTEIDSGQFFDKKNDRGQKK